MEDREVRRLEFRQQVSNEIAEIDLRQIAQDLHGKDFRDQYLGESLCWVVRSQVRLIREDRGWTQEELADKSGVSLQTINRIENLSTARIQCEIGTLLKLAQAFDVALMVRFEAWSDYLRWLAVVKAKGVEELIPRTFDATYPELEAWAEQPSTTE